jgi:sugar phosphate permease
MSGSGGGDKEAKPLSYRWVIFGVLAAQYLFGYFHRVCPAVVAPELIKAFNISGTALGVLASGYFYPYAAMQLPAGILADSWGAKRTVIMGALVAAVGTVLFGLSPTFGFAVFSRILVGLGVSVMFVTTLKIFANWFKPTEFARISALLMAAGGGGWFIAATPLAVFSEYFSWRWAFLALGFVTLFLTGLTRFTVSDRPDESRFTVAYQKKRSPAGPRRHIGADIALILRERHFWPLGAWMFLTGMGSFGFFSLWAGPYLMDAYGFSKTTTGNVLTMLPCAMVFGGPFLGYLSDKVLASRKRVLSWVSVTYAASWLVLFLYYDSLPFMALLVIFFLLGATGTGGAPIAYTATKELFSAEMAGTSIGAVNFFAFLGGVVAQPLIGFFLDRAGKVGAHYPSSAYQPVILSYFLVSLIILAVVFFVKETIRPERAERIK